MLVVRKALPYNDDDKRAFESIKDAIRQQGFSDRSVWRNRSPYWDAEFADVSEAAAHGLMQQYDAPGFAVMWIP